MPGFNVRDMTSVVAREKLDVLKAQIKNDGVRVPLELRMEGEDLYVVSGHRRLHVVMELIAEGEEILSVPAIMEAKHLSDAERAVGLVTLNQGEPLTPLEVAEVVRRLLGYGWDRSQIARRLGFKAVQTVSNYEEMLSLPHEVREAVREGTVSATNARAIVREAGPLMAPERLKEAKATAKRIGKKKVTAKSMTPRKPSVPAVEAAPVPEPPRNQAKVEHALADLHAVVAAEYPASVAASVYRALSADDVLAICVWLSEFETALSNPDDEQSAAG